MSRTLLLTLLEKASASVRKPFFSAILPTNSCKGSTSPVGDASVWMNHSLDQNHMSDDMSVKQIVRGENGWSSGQNWKRQGMNA